MWDGASTGVVSTAPQKGLMIRVVFLEEVGEILSTDLSAFELLIILQLGGKTCPAAPFVGVGIFCLFWFGFL